jgi:spoIIIJ-associated protein
VQLDGKDVAHLVGKHGEVLNALQYLINIMAGRRFGNGVRVTLDGNDFRKRREDQLTQLAQNIADQVRKRQEEAVLDALPAFERRIVHKALSDLGGITTYSEGEEPNRRVVIAPAEV